MLNEITSPTLLISEQKVRDNLRRMAERAERHGLALRPHFKTHQSAIVSEWLRDYGVREVSVTSLRMAREAAAAGWEGITVAMPLNPREIGGLSDLASKSAVSVFLTDPVTAATLAREATRPIRYFIEVDAGYGRSGVPIRAVDTLRRIITAAGAEGFRGFYVHSGHTYDAVSSQQINEIHQKLLIAVAELRAAFSEWEHLEIAIGDPPACSSQEDFQGITSIGPGNFVYYDLVQADLGVCQLADIAVCLAAPVVQVFPERGEAIIHGGWVQLGKDQLSDGSYGKVVLLGANGGWSIPTSVAGPRTSLDASSVAGAAAGAKVIKLSQEHGTIRLPRNRLEQLQPGDLVGILPVHACATVHGMRAAGQQHLLS